MHWNRSWSLQGIGLGLLMIAGGCGGVKGPELAMVTGIVTLDGQPLPEARLVFQPSGKAASPSIAETSPDGRFKLAFNRNKSGAMIGTHQVKITTAKLVSGDGGKETFRPEKLPPRYNGQSELAYQVQPGRNNFEIKLESHGSPTRPGQSWSTASQYDARQVRSNPYASR
jgi:hypothetical protein